MLAIESQFVAQQNQPVLVKRAAIAITATVDTTIVAAVTGKKIRVLSLYGHASAGSTVRLESGTGGTALTGAMPLAANGQLNLPYNPHGHCETAAGALLNLELSTGNFHGVITYCEVN